MSLAHANISIFVPHLGCPNMCSFCNQHHIARTSSVPTEEDVHSAVKTAVNSKNYCPGNTELAFFGGSFTAIDREYMLLLLESAKKHIDSGDVCGIRISTRPDAIDEEILSVLKKYGVTTIELGAQSMCDRVLSLNDRGHTENDVVVASQLIKNSGFSLGLQMMTGLYGSNALLDIETAQKIINLKPDCVRIYPTITLEGTKLETLYRSGEYFPPSLDETVGLCVTLNDMFLDANIPVIRLGLHTIDENSYIAGPWHPAFKELCDSKKYRNIISSKIEEKGIYTVFVSRGELSKAIGQKKENILFFKEMGIDIKFKEDFSLKKYDVLVKGCE